MRWSQVLTGGLLAAAALVFTVGCGPAGPATVPVTGKVTIGGQPAKDVLVTFNPADPNGVAASGKVENGTYTLLSGSTGKPGAMVGKYKVTLSVTSSETPDYSKMAEGGMPPGTAKAPFAAEYSNPSATPLEFEVKSGSNTIDIEVPAAQ